MKILVDPGGFLTANDLRFRCALGRSGVSRTKREGDGATPVGNFPLRRLLYRPDRIGAPETGLSVTAIDPRDGWCDDPTDVQYNRSVRLPYGASCETMWREDHLYDVVVVLGHNDDPVEPHQGSAIFLHCAKADYGPTEGCVALAITDLLSLLSHCGPDDSLTVRAAD